VRPKRGVMRKIGRSPAFTPAQTRDVAKAAIRALAVGEPHHGLLLGAVARDKGNTVSCKEFLRGLKSRRLRDPVLIVTDRTPGLIRAVEDRETMFLQTSMPQTDLTEVQKDLPKWRALLSAINCKRDCPSV